MCLMKSPSAFDASINYLHVCISIVYTVRIVKSLVCESKEVEKNSKSYFAAICFTNSPCNKSQKFCMNILRLSLPSKLSIYLHLYIKKKERKNISKTHINVNHFELLRRYLFFIVNLTMQSDARTAATK